MRKMRRAPDISRVIALTFLCLILCGTVLLCLPVSSRDGHFCGVRKALFTAASATCVTGLTLADTYTQWSGFGQTVLLCLIELGGLGFMAAVSFAVSLLRRKLSLAGQMLTAQSIGSETTGDVLRTQKRGLYGSLLAEAVGAAVLAIRFLPEYGARKAVKLGIFHAVSAFCNAGFDIFGFETPGGSLCRWHTDPTVCLTLSALIAAGGVGFLVWEEVLFVRRPKKWSVYTKLALLTTGGLLLCGTLFIALAEWNNPQTLGALPAGKKWLAAFFQSATSRTAGFAGLDQSMLTDGGKAITVFFMLIGGSSGSTAGGLKTVTFVVLLLFLWARLRGKKQVTVFHRTLRDDQITGALSLFGMLTMLAFFGGTFITLTSPVGFTDALYESVSALATVGLTAGATAKLTLPAQLLMIVYMYFGRVGIFTVSLGLLHKNAGDGRCKYAETTLLIG